MKAWKRHMGLVILAPSVILINFLAGMRYLPSHHTLTNHGLAFGLLGHRDLPVAWLEGAGVVVVMLLYLRWRWARYPLAFVLGGAMANFLSRLVYGGVLDYWHLAPYPYTFNFADVAIRGGLIALLIIGLRTRPESARAANP